MRSFRPLRVLRAACHRLIGRIAYHSGARRTARRAFESVLELRGDDFLAYVYLGRIAYDGGDILGWRRECMHARRVAPARYARLRARFELRSRFELYEPAEPLAGEGGGGLAAAGERATWRAPADEPASFGAIPPLTAIASLHSWGDDFTSETERAAFCRLEPISRSDLEAVDLDELARELGAWCDGDDGDDPGPWPTA